MGLVSARDCTPITEIFEVLISNDQFLCNDRRYKEFHGEEVKMWRGDFDRKPFFTNGNIWVKPSKVKGLSSLGW